jgi:hypothetical protein
MEKQSLKSRKIVSFIIVLLGVIALVYVTTKIHTPENVAIQALWVIGAGGLFTIGGQSLVDSVAKWREPHSEEKK